MPHRHIFDAGCSSYDDHYFHARWMFQLGAPKGPQRQFTEMVCMVLRLCARASEIQTICMLQGPLGQSFAKPTRLLLGRLPWMAEMLYQAYDRKWVATENLGGWNQEQGEWNTAKAKAYPVRMSQTMAAAYHRYVESIAVEGHEPEPHNLEPALKALASWDPYADDGKSSFMKSDYHPNMEFV